MSGPIIQNRAALPNMGVTTVLKDSSRNSSRHAYNLPEMNAQNNASIIQTASCTHNQASSTHTPLNTLMTKNQQAPMNLMALSTATLYSTTPM